jgi:co-chaperonin GroES (HSP10)
MKLINNRLLLQPSVSRMRGGIAIPHSVAEATNMCRILIKGNLVSPFLKEGDVVICENGFSERKTMTIEDCFICKESNIVAKLQSGMVYPIGKKILIRRDVQEDNVHGIVIPANRMYQSLTGTVVRFGITRQRFNVFGIEIGDKIGFQEWNESMIEVSLEDGSYGLIVNENDLVYKIEN